MSEDTDTFYRRECALREEHPPGTCKLATYVYERNNNNSSFVFVNFLRRELCHTILEKHGEDYQLGTTRVFLRENLERQLERERAEILHKAAMIIQRNVRGFLTQKRYQNAKHSAIKIQSAVRGWKERKKYVVLRRGVIKTQALYRGRKQRQRYNQLKVSDDLYCTVIRIGTYYLVGISS